ncbi:MAG TPA: hypothetical protein VLG27_00110 [Candidatus Saccharimonadia bacterium]|nr:hypothetical protein [Candidatus Saccharimonadia bacterium]
MENWRERIDSGVDWLRGQIESGDRRFVLGMAAAAGAVAAMAFRPESAESGFLGRNFRRGFRLSAAGVLARAAWQSAKPGEPSLQSEGPETKFRLDRLEKAGEHISYLINTHFQIKREANQMGEERRIQKLIDADNVIHQAEGAVTILDMLGAPALNGDPSWNGYLVREKNERANGNQPQH